MKQKSLRIFVDMDGVLVNLDEHIAEILGPENIRPTPIDWSKLYELAPLTFLEATRMEDADVLMRFLRPFKPKILTAEPNRWSWPNCAAHKKAWIQSEYGHEIHTIVVPHAIQKQLYCLGPEYVLIDDSHLNISQWNEAGGCGILHENAEQTINELLSYGI